jgi:hypothetical protein
MAFDTGISDPLITRKGKRPDPDRPTHGRSKALNKKGKVPETG